MCSGRRELREWLTRVRDMTNGKYQGICEVGGGAGELRGKSARK